MFLFGIFLFAQLSFAWWWFPALILLPDLGIVGYAAGNKAGAIVYNLFHHKGIAVALFVVGFIYNNWALQVSGIILFGHSSMDRMFGYGLKTNEGFKFTHMGLIGKK